MPTATTWYRLVLLCGLLGGQHAAIPQSTGPTTAPQVWVVNDLATVYTTSEPLSPNQVMQRIEKGTLPISTEKSSPGFSANFFWIHFVTQPTVSGDYVLTVDNPHIDTIQIYLRRNEQWQLVSQGGDKMPFHDRTYVNRRFVCPLTLTPGQTTEVLIKVDKRNASVSFPVRLWPEDEFYTYETSSALLYGIYFGVMGFIAVFSLGIGLMLRDRNFLIYGLYVALIGLYVFVQLGYGFQYLYPASAKLNNFSRIILSLFSTLVTIEFFSRLLNIRTYLPWMRRVYTSFRWVLLGILALWTLNRLLNPNYEAQTVLTLNLYYVLLLLFFGTIVFTCFKTWKYQRNTSMFVLSSFIVLMIGSSFYILIEFGVLPESAFPINPILIGSVLEVIILSVTMTWRVKNLNDGKNELTQKLMRQQKELMRAFVQGGEKERSRISAELHDHLGASLSLLKSKIAHRADQASVQADIDQLCEDVRTLSHQLMPSELELTGLHGVLKSFCAKFEENTGTKVQLEFFGVSRLPNEHALALLRIAEEALQNVLRHAKASLVEIQVLGYDDTVVMTIDDDGAGFDRRLMRQGNGFINIQARVETLNGQLDVASYPGKGTNLVVTLPLPGENHSTS